MKPRRIDLHIGRLVVDGPVASREALQAALAEALQRELAGRWSAQAAPGPLAAASVPRWSAALADAISSRWSPAAAEVATLPRPPAPTGARDV